ncbi:WD40 repeat-like protein [Laetiporus sulphureus 93-53]|uniref:WD40 repeat-like protein n=1 Tax=Laetiporus sulphureus 93-53 TaxID=1314785 RepID=A0A165EEC6_9APHY|nr:WD40 repeat-like protein [Laetiporus sulphureus 93-53]KZT06861.1 WD40 repeat-like protein [Laetiporus sulphureus 93-53]
MFVSCGTDRKVSVWSCKEVESGALPKLVHEMYYECTMGLLLFKPREPLLAMGGRDGQIYLQTHSRAPIARSRIRVAPTDSSQEIGDMLWGKGSTEHMLFASTGELEPDVFSGVHKALDVPTRKAVCVFDISEDGEKIAIDNYGANLVLATRSTDVAHSLRLYDARRLRPRATSKVDLEPFVGDVNALQFSPDGIYLAVARSDNTVHIFDSRKLTRGALHVFSHEYGDVDEKHCFGVVNALWVDGTAQGLSLVTGGADGCIRSWDVRRASNDPSNGVVLARHDRDIGYFALGDPYKNEKPLLVGENSGIVTIYEGSLRSSPL